MICSKDTLPQNTYCWENVYRWETAFMHLSYLFCIYVYMVYIAIIFSMTVLSNRKAYTFLFIDREWFQTCTIITTLSHVHDLLFQTYNKIRICRIDFKGKTASKRNAHNVPRIN